jgi:hypothetical protein
VVQFEFWLEGTESPLNQLLFCVRIRPAPIPRIHISVVWDDYTAYYPGEYIGKCIEAYERSELPEEIYQRGQHFLDIYERIQKLFDQD